MNTIFTQENEDKFIDAIKLEAEREAAEQQNPFKLAAERLLTEHPEPTIEQALTELTRL